MQKLVLMLDLALAI